MKDQKRNELSIRVSGNRRGRPKKKLWTPASILIPSKGLLWMRRPFHGRRSEFSNKSLDYQLFAFWRWNTDFHSMHAKT